jgi:hypothetical protein
LLSRGVSSGVVIVVTVATAPTITTPISNSSWSYCSSTVRIISRGVSGGVVMLVLVATVGSDLVLTLMQECSQMSCGMELVISKKL